jgi:hypothetical protein
VRILSGPCTCGSLVKVVLPPRSSSPKRSSCSVIHIIHIISPTHPLIHNPVAASLLHTRRSTKHHISIQITPRVCRQSDSDRTRTSTRPYKIRCPKPTPAARHSRQTRTVPAQYRLLHSLPTSPRILGDRFVSTVRSWWKVSRFHSYEPWSIRTYSGVKHCTEGTIWRSGAEPARVGLPYTNSDVCLSGALQSLARQFTEAHTYEHDWNVSTSDPVLALIVRQEKSRRTQRSARGRLRP